MKLNYSFIIHVYNRPQEIMELLDSFLGLRTEEDYEIVIVEDGSSERSEDIVAVYLDKLNISYYYKENYCPRASRFFFKYL